MASSEIDTTLAIALYNVAVDFDSDSQLIAIRDGAFAKIASGDYALLTSLTINGKTAQYVNPITPFDVLKSSQLALSWWKDGGIITSEVPDFRFIY